MSLIKWNDSFSVNVVKIDQEHKKLFEIVNELTDAMKAGHGKDVLGNILDRLISYTASHFQLEENYFQQVKYPDAAAHKKEHVAFVQKVTDFKKEFDDGRATVSVNILQFLSKWLQTHIKGTDQKYSSFLNEKGIK
ncbi:hemerythrin [Candidatus Electrothrix communis]|uniref:Hemerythrin n=1 Tax=Candidatus Electrothrix communis TaxID=1859133 RepID=A0A3S3R298_9BACT|nr:hemerythrin [Candidatus Electrothrix communis]WLE97529.1 MAG: bacteriohemerythrin [Candidatus Electrothrix communis]